MPRAFFFKTLFFFFYRILFRKLKSLRRNVSNVHHVHATKSANNNNNSLNNNSNSNNFHKFQSLSHRSDLNDNSNESNTLMIFNVEGALLRSSSLFPYFMLVAFEAGGLIRSIILFLTYPFLCLVSDETKLNVMVMICFLGLKKESFRVGSSVLPKYFLEDVGFEAFKVVQMGYKRVAVTNLPLVMVECFLRDYLKVEFVVGREMKLFCGYYLGLMEDKKNDVVSLEETFCSIRDHDHDMATIGITDFRSLGDHQLLSLCKDIYLVSRSEKLTWQNLPATEYPTPLIFHDGRLAIRPTWTTTLQLFTWAPLAIILAICRITVALSLPYDLSIPILAFSGLHLSTSLKPRPNKKGPGGGILYVCNHRTLLDPLYLCFALKTKMTALTYSLSRLSEILAPIRTVRLTRDRAQDSATMDKLLSQGDLVVCPEGTTCRESFLLRFSPLFSEITDEIVPVAVGTHVGMFHGTTAGGFKCLDPFFFMMNPNPAYEMKILEKMDTCRESNGSRFDVANRVQRELGLALGFECTSLNRRDKYLVLAGNEGFVNK